MYPMHSVPPRGLALVDLIARFGANVHVAVVFVAKALARGVVQRWKGRQDRLHLLAMDHRQLEDIGVERYEINAALGKAPWFYTND